MPLHNRIYKLQLFKSLLISLALFSAVEAMTETKIAQICARKQRKKDKRNIKIYDTLFCANKALAHYRMHTWGTDTFKTMQFSRLNDTHVVLKVSSIVGPKQKNYWHYDFIDLKQSADRAAKGLAQEVQNTVCYYDLLNQQGLDTLKAELFITLHGNLKTQQVKKVDPEKTFIVERNKNAKIVFEEQEISQDGILLGRYEEEELEGPNGKFIQYSIFNSTGALVCVASRVSVDPNSQLQQWNLLTYRDMRFSSVQLQVDSSLNELMKYLIQKAII